MSDNPYNTSNSPTIIQRYHALPRAGQWLVWLVIGLIFFLAVAEPVLRLTTHYNIEADKKLKSIDKYAHLNSQIAQTIDTGQKRWGNVLPPTDDPSRVFNAKAKITAVLEQNGISREVTMIERPAQRVKTDESTLDIIYMRGPIEIKFTARPHVASAVLADIEALPEVAMIASVRLRRLADRAEVETTIVADAWYTRKD
jgi:hypothetical protein